MSFRESKESGMSKIVLIFLLILFGLSLHFAMQAVTHYYAYSEVAGLIKHQVIQAEQRTDAEIRVLIEDEMRRNNISADPEDLKISSGRSQMEISLYWEEDIELYINDDYNWIIHTFEFDIEEIGETTSIRNR